MSCCVADATAIGIVAQAPELAVVPDDQWLTVSGRFAVGEIGGESVTPAAGAPRASTLTAIEVRFSERVDPAGRAVSFSVEPAVDAALRWGARTVRFFPDRPLAASTSYAVRLDGTLRSASGRRLRGPVAWSFDTAALRVAYVADGPVSGGRGERTRIAARAVVDAGAPAAWRHGALGLLTSDLREAADGRFADAVVSVDLTDLRVRMPLDPASGGARSPAWAPEGNRFAFIRAADDGEQLWLATAADGLPFEAALLVAAPRYTYREMVFAPGGDLIAAQRSRLDVPFPEPEVVVIDGSGRELTVIAGAATPRWLP